MVVVVAAAAAVIFVTDILNYEANSKKFGKWRKLCAKLGGLGDESPSGVQAHAPTWDLGVEPPEVEALL